MDTYVGKILITGASSGIGKATALLFAEEGYQVFATGRRRLDMAELGRSFEPGVIVPMVLDMRKRTAVENAFKAIGPVDVLINNAGLALGMEPFHEGDVDFWEDMIDTNIKGILYASHTVAQEMIQAKKGHIIHVTSLAARQEYPGGNVYSATKAAVDSLTRSMRIDLAPHGIKVGSIAPGMVDTEFSRVRFLGDERKAQAVYEGMKPLTAEDIAQTLLWMVKAPEHVNIADVLILPTAQASVRDVTRVR